MGSDWAIMIAGAAIGAGFFFGMERLGEGMRKGMSEGMKNIGFQDHDIELGKIKVRKLLESLSPAYSSAASSPRRQ